MKPTLIRRPHARPASRWPMLLAAAAIACSLTACGGDHSDDETPTPPNTPQPAPEQPPAPVLHCAP